MPVYIYSESMVQVCIAYKGLGIDPLMYSHVFLQWLSSLVVIAR
jgi:hypothetical protein